MINEVDKLIINKSKGKLVIQDNENKNDIKYKISTYKGQRGPSIFLRDKRISNITKEEYGYQFLGLH